MPHWIQCNKCSHTTYTVLHSEACVPDHVQKPDPQRQTFYKHYLLQHTVPQQDHTVPSRGSRSCFNHHMPVACTPLASWLWQITACPFYPIKWKEDKMGRERDLLLRNNWKWVVNVRSSALRWNYHNMLRGTVMYCLYKYPSCHFRNASHFDKICNEYYATETIRNPHPLIS